MRIENVLKINPCGFNQSKPIGRNQSEQVFKGKLPVDTTAAYNLYEPESSPIDRLGTTPSHFSAPWGEARLVDKTGLNPYRLKPLKRGFLILTI